MQGAINAFDMPARQSFVVQMIERREDLGNAIALNSSMVNGARLIGPAVAGMLIAAVGEGYCFLIDGFSYMAVIASLLAMRVAPPPAQSRAENGSAAELARGMAVCCRIRAHPLGPAVPDFGEPGRDALHGADADLRGLDSARRRAHAWDS